MQYLLLSCFFSISILFVMTCITFIMLFIHLQELSQCDYLHICSQLQNLGDLIK